MNKILIYSTGMITLSAVGLALVPSFVNAQGATNMAHGNGSGYQQVIETKAKLLGMTVEDLQSQLQTKTMLQIATDKGISEDQLHNAMQSVARARWTEKGLSQSEIDSRMKNMVERQAGDHENNSVNRGGMRHGNFNQ